MRKLGLHQVQSGRWAKGLADIENAITFTTGFQPSIRANRGDDKLDVAAPAASQESTAAKRQTCSSGSVRCNVRPDRALHLRMSDL